MKRFLVVFIATLLLTNTFSQVVGGENEKLAKLFNQGKYESCLFKADNLTYKEETKRDPEPYLYLSMCFYELSKSEDEIIAEDYKDGLKQAIKYAAKFAKKDKTGEMYGDNIEYINMLKDEQKKKIKTELNNNKYRKAGSAAKLYNRLNKETDYTVLYFVGMCEILSNNFSQGSRNMEQSQEKLEEQLSSNSFKAESRIKPVIIDGFLKYSEFLVNESRAKEAASLLEFGLKLFQNDGYLKVQYNLITKSLEENKQE